MQTLYPSKTDTTNGSVSLKTLSWVDAGQKACRNRMIRLSKDALSDNLAEKSLDLRLGKPLTAKKEIVHQGRSVRHSHGRQQLSGIEAGPDA